MRLLLLCVACVLCQSCTRATGHDPNGNPWSFSEFGTNRNVVRVAERSTGKASLNPFAGMFGGTRVPVQDAAGNVIYTTTADRLRDVQVVAVESDKPIVSIGGDTGLEMYGTQDQTSMAREIANGATNIIMIKWMGRVWRALIFETGTVIQALNE